MTTPIAYSQPYVRCQDPNFRQWLSPLESRRMGSILKRAIVTSQQVMDSSGILQPDAVITGTGLGCIDSTEQFLSQLNAQGEQMLKPTCFMQSTHNTISSLIAIHHRLHGYNTTYSHGSLSFESALMDAFIQLRLGDIDTALVTGNDELTPTYYRILQRAGLLGQPGQVTASEASVAMMLTTSAAGALCQVLSVDLTYEDMICLPLNDVDLLVLGYNGVADHDLFYDRVAACLPAVSHFCYKQLFGEGYSASALGVYAAAHLIAAGRATGALFVNRSHDGNCSCIMLKQPSA